MCVASSGTISSRIYRPTVVDRVAEVIYWERPDGGRVFNGGAIANSVALNYDPLFAGLVSNVLRHFRL